MLQFVCDTCSAVRQDDEPWIVGLAAEAIGVTSARRELTVLPAWDRVRAVDSLAVHFCSIQCKDTYMERLFGPEAVGDEIVVERTIPAATTKTRRTKATKQKVITEIARRRRPTRKKIA